MKAQLSNALWGVLDYASFPLGMLLVVPVLLRHLATSAFGMWAFAMTVVNLGAVLGSGFGDANIQRLAQQRAASSFVDLLHSVRAVLAVHLALGSLIAGVICLLASYLAGREIPQPGDFQADALLSLRWASLLVFFRTLETVPVSTQRAFLRYKQAVRVSVIARWLSLLVVSVLAIRKARVSTLLASTVVISSIGLVFQLWGLHKLLRARLLLPSVHRASLRSLWRFGAYSWLQQSAQLVFEQSDRLFVGVILGPSSLAGYTLCAQLTQPISGIAAAGLHFLFPLLAECTATDSDVNTTKIVAQAFVANLAFVLGTGSTLIFVGPFLLHLWAGRSAAASSASILPLLVLGSCLRSLGITPTYSLYALGKIRMVTLISAASGALMLLSIPALCGYQGARGLACSRVIYGATMLSLYFPLLRHLRLQKPYRPTTDIQPAGWGL